MSGERRAPADYRWARQAAALLLVVLVVVIVAVDVWHDDYRLNPSVLVPLLLTAAGMLSVDVPRLKGPR